jgi:hypothetical protein
MPQRQFYVPDAVAKQLFAHARAVGLSVSRYLATAVGGGVAHGRTPGFFDDVIGGWKGTPLRQSPRGRLETREVL